MSETYHQRRALLLEYFDRTAIDAWARLTSDAPLNPIRATVRAGRDAMRNALLQWLPERLDGMRLLDAGCGTGALSHTLAQRGANVLACDLSPRLIDIARTRGAEARKSGALEFVVSDMLDVALGEFDCAIAMDSLIHYQPATILAALEALAQRVRRSLLFTFAPRNALLAGMHALGHLFPRGNRAPEIVPIAEKALIRGIGASAALSEWRIGRTQRVARGFYISQALELVRK